MKNILDWIEENKQQFEGHEPRNMELAKASPWDYTSNVNNPGLEQTEVLRPGETLEEWEPNPFLKPHADGGRAGYNDGQLVTPNVDGSRPGYADKPILPRSEFVKLRIKYKKTHTNTEFAELLNKYWKPSQADSFNKDSVTKRIKDAKHLFPDNFDYKGSNVERALTPEKYISVIGEEEYARLKDSPKKLKWRYEYLRDIKNRPNFLEIRKKRSKEWKASLNPQEYEDKILQSARKRNQQIRGTEAKFYVNRNDAKSMMWKDLVSRTHGYEQNKVKKVDTYFTFEKPIEAKKNYKIADMKDIVLKDKKGNRFTFDTLFDDIKKVAGEAEFKNFKNTYDQRAFLNKEGITTELNKLYGYEPGSMKSVFHVQHIEGFNKAPFKVHLTFADQNKAEAGLRRTFTTDFGNASKLPTKTAKEREIRFGKMKDATKNYYKSLGPDIVAQIGKKPKGEAKTLINLLDKSGIKLTDTQRAGALDLATAVRALCPKGKAAASGGRIGYQDAGAVTGTLQCGIDQFNKNLKTGNANSSLMRRILGTGKNLVKGVGGMLNPIEFFKLKNWIGKPAAVAIGLYETWDMADDAIRKGIPWNESVAENWLFGNVLNMDKHVEEAKNILNDPNLSPAAKNYAQSIIDVKRYEDLENKTGWKYGETALKDLESEMATIRHNVTHGGETGRFDYESALAEKQGSTSEYVGEPKKVAPGYYVAHDGKEVRKVNEVGYAIKGEAYDAPDKIEPRPVKAVVEPSAKRDYFKTLFDMPPSPFMADRGTVQMVPDLKKPVEPDSPVTREEVNRLYQNLGFVHPIGGEAPKEILDEIEMEEKVKYWSQLMDQERMRPLGKFAQGGRAGYMGGGIASILKPSEIPPERQGLRSIMINAKDN